MFPLGPLKCKLFSGVPSAEADKLLEKGMTTKVEIMRTGESASGAKRWSMVARWL